eukprot:CAMPEP_0169419792 /NCGR_PEP_ID=MMETSP1017-20121227/65197_1 /TAXON_ID=342587 /ORGANISM="Karlodinium micrum, Strain CCMP2283" /LENGTH=193 /DNA_ID=CAMNT_0009528535 /DNA_START=141 /DNA_END=723 /DNA_ORIENTATION=-
MGKTTELSCVSLPVAETNRIEHQGVTKNIIDHCAKASGSDESDITSPVVFSLTCAAVVVPLPIGSNFNLEWAAAQQAKPKQAHGATSTTNKIIIQSREYDIESKEPTCGVDSASICKHACTWLDPTWITFAGKSNELIDADRFPDPASICSVVPPTATPTTSSLELELCRKPHAQKAEHRFCRIARAVIRKGE